MKELYKPLIILSAITLSACGSDSTSDASADPLSYKVKINSQEDVVLESAQIRIRVYGTDRHVADNEATVISNTVQSINEVPVTLDLQWPENAYQLIDSPPVSEAVDAAYYFTVEVDANGDSVMCAGDYVQDYDETPFETIDGIPADTKEILIRTSEAESCSVF